MIKTLFLLQILIWVVTILADDDDIRVYISSNNGKETICNSKLRDGQFTCDFITFKEQLSISGDFQPYL